MGVLDKAEKVMRVGVRKLKHEATCQLGLAAVLLLKDDQPATLAQVKCCLDGASKLTRRKTEPSLRAAVEFHRAIYLALTGQEEQSRQLFDSVYGHDPDDPWAARALAIFWDADQQGPAKEAKTYGMGPTKNGAPSSQTPQVALPISYWLD
jgi:hypothetical protein